MTSVLLVTLNEVSMCGYYLTLMTWLSENAEQMQEELKQQPSMIERLYGK